MYIGYIDLLGRHRQNSEIPLFHSRIWKIQTWLRGKHLLQADKPSEEPAAEEAAPEPAQNEEVSSEEPAPGAQESEQAGEAEASPADAVATEEDAEKAE